MFLLYVSRCYKYFFRCRWIWELFCRTRDFWLLFIYIHLRHDTTRFHKSHLCRRITFHAPKDSSLSRRLQPENSPLFHTIYFIFIALLIAPSSANVKWNVMKWKLFGFINRTAPVWFTASSKFVKLKAYVSRYSLRAFISSAQCQCLSQVGGYFFIF